MSVAGYNKLSCFVNLGPEKGEKGNKSFVLKFCWIIISEIPASFWRLFFHFSLNLNNSCAPVPKYLCRGSFIGRKTGGGRVAAAADRWHTTQRLASHTDKNLSSRSELICQIFRSCCSSAYQQGGSATARLFLLTNFFHEDKLWME